MDNFLLEKDELGNNINLKARYLFEKLSQLPVDNLGMPYHCLEYFKGSHFKRLFFSIETSAHLLYRSIKEVNKPVNEITLMDYGAGVGTLYTLAKMIGCKKVVYNDHLADWKKSAELIATAIGVEVDEYIVGDIDDTLDQLAKKNIQCDIITSRNVIEHIYKLDHFFAAISGKQPNACVYSSTTANYQNPASRVKHFRWHQKWEKEFLPQRQSIIQKLDISLSAEEVYQLAKRTRGLAGNDIVSRVQAYQQTKKYPEPVNCRSNTCDPVSGVWFEHLLKFSEYRDLIEPAGYQLNFYPGFWDTHYASGWKNSLGKTLNSVINNNEKLGIRLAPFIYVVATKQQ